MSFKSIPSNLLKLSLAQLIALKWRYQKLDRNKWRSKKQRAVINQPYSALFAKNYESLCYKGCQFSTKFWIRHEYEKCMTPNNMCYNTQEVYITYNICMSIKQFWEGDLRWLFKIIWTRKKSDINI